ncbi:MAG TPA: aminopeptidase P family protein [Thermoanaerobaculia bacterium]|nr:aminopeptidase P family protein [Thermoanaerobaculia bacterium]
MRLASLGAALLLSSSLALAGPPAPGPDWFLAHRTALLAKLPKDAVVVLRAPAEPAQEVEDAYRPSPDFWYLTGFAEPDAVAVLRPAAPEGKRYLLFVRPNDWKQEQWTGRRAGVDGAKKLHRADAAFPVADFEKESRDSFAGAKALFYLDSGDEAFREKLLTRWNRLAANGTDGLPATDVTVAVGQMRLVKDETEIALLREAVALSLRGHLAAMALAGPGVSEGVLKAAQVSACLAGGAVRMAYAPIVGSGPNSVVLHYPDANRTMQAGEVVVNDTACEYGRYAADVTRTYPVSGAFSPEQRALYEIVLAAQKAGIAKAVAGAAYHEIQDAAVAVTVDGLVRLGLLKGTREELVKDRSFAKFLPHGTGHWLGLDVHDAGSYEPTAGPDPKDRFAVSMSYGAKLRPGMVLTVEPGIYIPEKTEGVDPRWWNIGIRIEDDVLVTSRGPECLSCDLPREIADVERAVTVLKRR